MVGKFLFLLAWASAVFAEDIGVTYEFSGGRFGDNLLSYLHAKWFAYERNIPLLYKSFPLSSKLKMDGEEKKLDVIATARFRVYLENGDTSQGNALYICPYFPEDPWELEHTLNAGGKAWFRFPVNWKDPGFRAAALKMIEPKGALDLILPPGGCISIAIHVREGGGHDGSEIQQMWPTKFPPIDFYIDALRTLMHRLGGRPIYCYLFTDAREPKDIAKQIEKAVPGVTLHYRKKNNRFNANILEDFFSLFHYDILIRSHSHFSQVPSLLHDYAAVYSLDEPGKGSWKIDEEIFQRLLR
ncbi:MAG TPA: hypothetical protein VLE89_01135 [Chlamydiales bacterium]|nr:hypothetical protein [Chlamydiales bacterium]